MRLLPTEIMAGSPIRSRDIIWVMTRVLMDNCGTSTVLMSRAARNVGTLDGARGRAASVPIEGVMFQIRNVNGAMPFPEAEAGKIPFGLTDKWSCLFISSAFLGAFPVLLQQSDAGNGGRGSIGQLLVNPVP